MVTAAMPRHPLRVVAPWYRWPAAARGRDTRPAIQKYDTPDLVNRFLADPTRSLRFTAEDHVHELIPRLRWTTERFESGKKRRLSDFALVRTELRKIFLETHGRHYLVVAEVHCDQPPGFPNARHAEICEAGLVVRRKRVTFAPGKEKQLSSIVGELLIQAKAAKDAAEAMTGDVYSPPAGEAEARYRDARAQLAAWVADPANGAAEVEEGWVPGARGKDGRWQPFDKLGEWRPLEQIADGEELLHPAYPLIPDPDAAGHPGAGRSIYFAILPSGGSDTDPKGTPRFDAVSLYQARIVVRRHKPQCERRPERGDCRGELFWSLPTEPYRLAEHFDLDGTSHRPITIQMPDLRVLAAQARPVHGVSVVYPPESSLPTTGFPPVAGIPGGGTCTFAIPLLTIVAQFVIGIFLPLLMFLFGLFWMLRLKFCLPPGALDAAVSAQLNAEFDAGVVASVQPSASAGVPELTAELELEGGVS